MCNNSSTRLNPTTHGLSGGHAPIAAKNEFREGIGLSGRRGYAQRLPDRPRRGQVRAVSLHSSYHGAARSITAAVSPGL